MLQEDAFVVLKKTSRTFFIPIAKLPAGLKEAVASAYLCMRAIDEIEDHPTMDEKQKVSILHRISYVMQTYQKDASPSHFALDFQDSCEVEIPAVSLRVFEWACMAPPDIAPRIMDATAAMADRMAYWALSKWNIRTVRDLDAYTFSVAGAVGLLLCDLWAWYDGTSTDRQLAVGFGRGLQAVNILRNDKEDRKRGISFYPEGWERVQMFAYARQNIDLGIAYLQALKKGPAADFCKIPLTLAKATLDVMSMGKEKLTREEVEALLKDDG